MTVNFKFCFGTQNYDEAPLVNFGHLKIYWCTQRYFGARNVMFGLKVILGYSKIMLRFIQIYWDTLRFDEVFTFMLEHLYIYLKLNTI